GLDKLAADAERVGLVAETVDRIVSRADELGDTRGGAGEAYRQRGAPGRECFVRHRREAAPEPGKGGVQTADVTGCRGPGRLLACRVVDDLQLPGEAGRGRSRLFVTRRQLGRAGGGTAFGRLSQI